MSDEAEATESQPRKRLRAALTAKRTALADQPVPTKDLLSSGSTLLNLACSGRVQGAFCKGRYFFYVGDSSSGKTFLALSCFAEACANKHFDDYRLIYDNVEDGALMQIEKFFGKKTAARLESPAVDSEGNQVFSRTIEEFYFNLHDALTHTVKDGGVTRRKPCIYILDSMDSLDSKYAGKKFLEGKNEARGGKKAKGDYGDGKAKANSQHARKMTQLLRDTGSILIVICQTRDNVNADMFSPKQTFSGGRAIKFFAALEIWTAVSKRMTREINSKKRQIGIISQASVKKNRLTGREWNVKVPLHWSTGIDDVGSMVDFLVEERHWPRSSKGSIKAIEFNNLIANREALIQHIENEGLERDLADITATVFHKIIAACEVKRKKRYE